MTWLRKSGVFSCFKTLFKVFNCPESKAKLSRTEGLVVIRKGWDVLSQAALKVSFRPGTPSSHGTTAALGPAPNGPPGIAGLGKRDIRFLTQMEK